jgi:two-component system response regulator AtoC
MKEFPHSRRVLVVSAGERGGGAPVDLAGNGYQVESVAAGQAASELLAGGERPGLVLLELDGSESLLVLRELVAQDHALPIVVTAEPNETSLLIEALESGAYNFLIRPVDREDLLAMLGDGNGNGHSRAAGPAACEERLGEDLWYVAASPAMLKIRQQLTQIAPTDVPVFINGESGVGKEVIARMIHELSARSDEAFIKVNCAALPGELLESELFGYEQGAFTGAVRPKPGKFESANRGTIFLDEIAEMAPHLQAKLLHVLQDSQFSRLGGRSTIHSDVRVLAATNTPVQQAIREGRFRKDLYYRLSVFSLCVPPLRERVREIPLLFRHFVEKYNRKYSRCSAQPPRYLLEAAARYIWPGNLRELENLVKRYVILGDAEETFRELLELSRSEHRQALEAPEAKSRGLKARVRDLKDETELEAILDSLEKTRWCRKRAAEQLGISYKALLYKMRRFHLDGGPGSRSAAVAVVEPGHLDGNGHVEAD